MLYVNQNQQKEKFELDISKIINFLSKECPACTIGLTGSFSQGEGIYGLKNKRTLYVSDYDLFMYFPILKDFIKARFNKKIRNLFYSFHKPKIEINYKKKNGVLWENISIAMVWWPLIKYRIKSMYSPEIIYGNKNFQPIIEQNYNFRESSEMHLQHAIYYYLTLLIEKDSYKKTIVLKKSVKYLVRYVIFKGEKNPAHFKIKENIRFLETKKQNVNYKDWIINKLKKLLIYKQEPIKKEDVIKLERLLLINIKPIKQHIKSVFTIKYNLRYWFFQIKNFRVPNILINPRKQYLKCVILLLEKQKDTPKKDETVILKQLKKELEKLTCTRSKYNKEFQIKKLLEYYHLKWRIK